MPKPTLKQRIAMLEADRYALYSELMEAHNYIRSRVDELARDEDDFVRIFTMLDWMTHVCFSHGGTPEERHATRQRVRDECNAERAAATKRAALRP